MNSSVRPPRRVVACRRAPIELIFAILFFLPFLDLHAAETSGNSLVRFEFIRGTNALGNIDVELFDQEKPETVRNFLLYVRSGAYSNSFIHRLVPGFALQGGGFAVTNPASADRFSTFLNVTNYGQVTNEFNIGARMSNLFGTIAMAKLGGDTNSASSQWFFNLGNNTTNLDNQNGGFTVFGKILENVGGTNDGLNVLEHFNDLSTNAGVVNLNSLLGPQYQAFTTVPVAYTNTITRVPNNRELYFVKVSLLNNARPPGTNAPTIALTSPGPNSSFTNETVRLKGTAADDSEVARVVYRVGDGPLVGAIGTTNWEVALDPPLGFQTVTMQSIDWEGNFSSGVSANFFFRRTMPLNLQITGRGTVSGVTNGQTLNANTFYTATAAPLAGSIFESWTGSITSSTPTLTFQAPTNATNFSLTAKFIVDPTPTLAGTYHGLFQTLGPTDYDGAGFMVLTMQSDANFSGTISYHGVVYNYTGKFDANGNANVVGGVGGLNRTIQLTLQKLTPAGLITGTFSGTTSTTLIQLERLAPNVATTTNAPPAGSYTFVIPLGATNSPSSSLAGGNGFGTGTLTSAGTFNLSGTLGDGTVFTAAPRLTRLGRFPFYLNLDAGRGAVWGWFQYKTNDTPKIEAGLTWIRKANGAAKYYPAGLTNLPTLVASLYNPEPGERVLNLVHGVARLSGTDLPNNFTNVVKLTAENTLQVLEPSQGMLQLNLNMSSGRVDGSFVNPFFGSTHQIQGALLTASNYIRGQYISGSEIGSFTLDMAPFLVTQSTPATTLPALESAMTEGGIIKFEQDGVIVLTNPLAMRFDTRLDANGHSVVISGGGTTRLVEVPTNLTFSAVGIVFANGFHQGANGTTGESPTAGGPGFGAGIMSLGGAVSLTNCVITNCIALGGDAGFDTTTNNAPAPGGAALGGGLYMKGGPVSLQNTVLAGNIAIAGGNRSITNALLVSKGDAMGMGAGLYFEGGDLNITDSTFLNNRVEGGEPLALSPMTSARAGDSAGGALAVATGKLTLNNSRFTSNTVASAMATNSGGGGHAYGGALLIESNVVVTIEKSYFEFNSAHGGAFLQAGEAPNAEGGAIFNAGNFTMRDSSMEQNSAVGGASNPAGFGRGGGLSSMWTGAITINSSVFNENTAHGGQFGETSVASVNGGEGSGGAIYTAANLTVNNSTFVNNHALGGSGIDPVGQTNAQRGVGRGGAIVLTSATANLVNLTVAYNEATTGGGNENTGGAFGGGFLNQNGTLSLRASIVASNTPSNFNGAITDASYNLSSDDSALLNSTSLTNKDPLILALSTNGGPTKTVAFLPESPARDAVRGTFPSTDQRGTLRPQGSFADIGAFEFVQTIPIFSVQPSGTNIVRLGTNITYQAQASGPGQVGYYWLKDGLQLTGAITATLTITNTQPEDAGEYSVVATNSFGASTSSIATLIIDLRPVILTNTGNVAVSPGAATSLVVNAIGPSLNYLWHRNQVPLPNETNSAFNILNASPGVEGSYRVIVSNFAGSVTSTVSQVTWSSAALVILSHPQSQTIAIGDTNTLSVLASGVTPINYQWFKDNQIMIGETNPTLTITNAIRGNSGSYRAVVNNPFLSLNSSNATITVVMAPLLTITNQGPTAVTVTVFGDPGRVHRLLTATNVTAGSSWSQIGTHTLPGSGNASWNLSAPTNEGPVFYRVITP